MLRPAGLRIWKRRWRCRELLCSAKTWTEPLEFLDAQVVLARRTGAEACRRVGELARPVSQVADEFGVCWETIMNAVVEHGTPLVDDPTRIGRVRQLGVDETSFLRANRHHHTIHATGLVDLEGHQMTGLVDLEGHRMIGLVDLEGHQMIDMIQGNAAVDLREWTANADPAWLAGSQVVATDLASRCAPGCRHASIMPPVSPTHSTSGREPLPRCRATTRSERDARPSGTQGRSALSDPQTASHRIRAAQRTRPRTDPAVAAQR